MCCMLSTFHVSSRIVANISEPSLLFFSIALQALLEKNTRNYHPYIYPCGCKVRLQCVAVRKECALQTHSRILQRTPTHSHILFCWKVRTTNALPGLHLQTKIHALQTHSWNFVFSKKKYALHMHSWDLVFNPYKIHALHMHPGTCEIDFSLPHALHMHSWDFASIHKKIHALLMHSRNLVRNFFETYTLSMHFLDFVYFSYKIHEPQTLCQSLNSFAPGRCPKIQRKMIFKCKYLLLYLAIFWWNYSGLEVIRFSSQHWFRWWLGTERQQAITWSNVEQNPCPHMASLGPNELKIEKLSILFLYSQILYQAHTLHIDEHEGMHIVVDTKRSFDPRMKEQTNENGRFMIFLFLMIILSYCNHDTVVTPDLRLANRRRCYNVTLSPIGQVQCSKYCWPSQPRPGKNQPRLITFLVLDTNFN